MQTTTLNPTPPRFPLGQVVAVHAFRPLVAPCDKLVA